MAESMPRGPAGRAASWTHFFPPCLDNKPQVFLFAAEETPAFLSRSQKCEKLHLTPTGVPRAVYFCACMYVGRKMQNVTSTKRFSLM